MVELAVVILNWNGVRFLERFLPSVVEHTPLEYDIWVADNASSDASVSFLKEHYPQVKIHINASNGGFAKGYNDALKHIEAKHYVLLNSDVEVTKNWIEPSLRMLKSNSLVAACQPKILSFHNSKYFEHAGAAGGYLDYDGYPFCKGRIFNIAEEDLGQYNKSSEVFWATGACLFIKSELFHLMGGFDEDFFAHMEEIDLCWRLKNRGYQIMYQPQSSVLHVGGGTLSIYSPFKLYLNFRNNLYLLLKNDRSSFILGKLFKRMILDGVAALKFLSEGNVKNIGSIIKAHFHFYLNFSKFIKKRKVLKLQDHNVNMVGLYRKNIIVQFFLKKNSFFSSLKDSDFIK